MSALDEIKSNTCPYCGAPYTIAAGGCAANCRMMALHARLVALAAEADIHEDDELPGGALDA